MPPWVMLIRVVVAVLVAGVSILFLLTTYWSRIRWPIQLCIGPVIGGAAVAAACTVDATTRVFCDRLQVDLSVAGCRLGSYQYPWATVTEVMRIDSKTPAAKRNRAVFRRAPSLTVVMYFGTGIWVRTAGSKEAWIGSNQVDLLLEAIATARGDSDSEEKQP